MMMMTLAHDDDYEQDTLSVKDIKNPGAIHPAISKSMIYLLHISSCTVFINKHPVLLI